VVNRKILSSRIQKSSPLNGTIDACEQKSTHKTEDQPPTCLRSLGVPKSKQSLCNDTKAQQYIHLQRNLKDYAKQIIPQKETVERMKPEFLAESKYYILMFRIVRHVLDVRLHKVSI
jgi:hypothetical protein